jgi:hypothetical protein
MNTITTANFGSYRNGEYLQFMKNVTDIYKKYDTDALSLTARVQTLDESTHNMNEVFMSATAHELTPELQLLDQRRDQALIGIRLYLECMTYKEQDDIIKAAKLLQANYFSHGNRIEKLSYQQETAVADALLNDWATTPSLVEAQNLLKITDWVSTLKDLNTQFNAQYISRAQTTIKPGQIEDKRSLMRQAYEDLVLDTVSYSRIAAEKTLYLAIIDGVNGLIGDYNQSVTLRLSGRSTDTDTDEPMPESKDQE